MMHSMWEVHRLAGIHHDELAREADRERMARNLQAAPGHSRVGRPAAGWAALVAALNSRRTRRTGTAGR